MAPARRLALALVVCLLLSLGWATAVQRPCHDPSHLRALKQDAAASGDDVSAEQRDVLHRLLHAYFPARYQHGVYPSDDEALDAVRADDAGLATAIARIAKRQNDNTTTASQQPTDGTTTVTSATTVKAPPPDTTTTTTPDNKPPATTTTTTTPDNNPPAETSTTKPPAAGSTTPGNPTGTSPEQPPSSSGVRPPSSSASLPSSIVPSSSPSQGPTSTSGKQTTPSTTPATTPSLAPTLSPSPTTFTSTDPNGNLVIVTSTSFVHVNPTGTKAGSSTSSTPGLQNAAMPMRTGSLLSDPFGAFVAGLMVLLAI